MNWKDFLKKMGIFLALFLALVGAGCSLGWLGYHGEWVPFAGEVIVVLMAVPFWWELLKALMK